MEFIRFKEAEDDCTEALNLDDRYIKAYSRRITARKELGKLKEAMEGIPCYSPSFFFFIYFLNIDLCCKPIMFIDAEFAISLDPNNPELRKQYSEIKALHMEVKKLYFKMFHLTS